MTEKTKTIAPPAMPIEQPSSVQGVSETARQQNNGNADQPGETNVQPEPFQLIPPFKISGKTKSMAKAAGIDLNAVEAMAPRLNDWATSVEARLNVILEAIPQLPAETIKALKAEAEKQRAEMMQRAQATGATAPAQGGDLMGMLGPLAQVLPALLGGGSSNPLSDEITKKVIEAGISQMFAGTELLKAMQTRLLANLGAKAIEEAMPK